MYYWKDCIVYMRYCLWVYLLAITTGKGYRLAYVLYSDGPVLNRNQSLHLKKHIPYRLHLSNRWALKPSSSQRFKMYNGDNNKTAIVYMYKQKKCTYNNGDNNKTAIVYMYKQKKCTYNNVALHYTVTVSRPTISAYSKNILAYVHTVTVRWLRTSYHNGHHLPYYHKQQTNLR